ncbi:MAG TPA: GNAT family N-acetyltransferase, partial [Phaeodactylibacter sp.]|nr:GNAT family N-acetyltransferase [Phaeodactylibacter sp.]
MKIKCTPFYQLNLDEIYAIMALRQEVFVVEQNCPYLDADDKDREAWHLMGFDKNNTLIAYTRLLPKGISYEKYASIGRVVTAPKARKIGAG